MTILCYHAVQPGWRSPLAVTPQAFEEQMRWLARHRRVVALEEAMAVADRRFRLPRGMTAITFDDGFSTLHDHAFPILRDLGLPSTVFVVAETLTEAGRIVDWVDTPPSGSSLRTLDLDQLLEMQDAGMTTGSHSFSHRVLTAMPPDEIESDLRQSRELLEDLLGRPVPFLAYPRGFHDEAVRSAAARAGYRNSFTLPESREAVGPHAVPRVGVYPGNGLRSLRTKHLRPYLAVRTSPVYPMVRRVVRGSAPPTRRAG